MSTYRKPKQALEAQPSSRPYFDDLTDSENEELMKSFAALVKDAQQTLNRKNSCPIIKEAEKALKERTKGTKEAIERHVEALALNRVLDARHDFTKSLNEYLDEFLAKHPSTTGYNFTEKLPYLDPKVDVDLDPCGLTLEAFIEAHTSGMVATEFDRLSDRLQEVEASDEYLEMREERDYDPFHNEDDNGVSVYGEL